MSHQRSKKQDENFSERVRHAPGPREPAQSTLSRAHYPMESSDTVLPADAMIKPEKQERGYRIGLSYACKRCGQPKKGHVCTAPPDGVTVAQPVQKKKRPDSDQSKTKTPSAKRARTDEAAKTRPTDPPSALTSHEDALPAMVLSDVQALLEVVDRPEGRPPSLITPDDDGEAVALSVLSTSLNSESWGQGLTPGENLFSPSQFLIHANQSAPTSMISATQLGSARLGLRFETTLSPDTFFSPGAFSPGAFSPDTLSRDTLSPAILSPAPPST